MHLGQIHSNRPIAKLNSLQSIQLVDFTVRAAACQTPPRSNLSLERHDSEGRRPGKTSSHDEAAGALADRVVKPKRSTFRALTGLWEQLGTPTALLFSGCRYADCHMSRQILFVLFLKSEGALSCSVNPTQVASTESLPPNH